jgi:hypothetical protein
MKKSEIKDLYNQSNEALTLLKAYVKMLPYADDNKATLQAIDTAAHLVTIVKTMCDYMIDDGSTDMTARLQDIKAEAKQIELDVAKMGYDKERFAIMLNCRAVINNIKDMEEWTANGAEPQQKPTAAPQQPSDGSDVELADSDKETQPEGAKKRVKVFKKDCILVDDKEQYLKALHKQIDGEKSADVIIAKIKGAISNKRILHASYQTLINEFPNIEKIIPRSTYYEKIK